MSSNFEIRYNTRSDIISQIPDAIKHLGNDAWSTVVGAFSALATAVSFGRCDLSERVKGLRRSKTILTTPFSTIILVMRPSAEVYNYGGSSRSGIVSSFVVTQTSRLNWESGFAKRFKIVATAPFLAVAKVVDLALGLIAAVFAILTTGYSTKINQFAYGQLRAFSVIALPFTVLYGLWDLNDKTVNKMHFGIKQL